MHCTDRLKETQLLSLCASKDSQYQHKAVECWKVLNNDPSHAAEPDTLEFRKYCQGCLAMLLGHGCPFCPVGGAAPGMRGSGLVKEKADEITRVQFDLS